MFKFVYGTDFHGDVVKFSAILNFAKDHSIPLIHLGADLLPKGSDMLVEQKNFVNGFLKKYNEKAKNMGIDVLGNFGNDDIYTIKKYFRKYASLLDEAPYSRDGYDFQAYPFVADYPFGLKTATKLDYEGWACPDPYLGPPCDFDEQGYFEIPDIKEYFRKKGTIEEDLKHLHTTNKTIMSMHMPPAGVDLDVCYGNRRVGSRAIYSWIEKHQPLLTLHGHIHESYEVTGVWKTHIGSTLVVQPGQGPTRTHVVYFEISDQKVEAHFLKL
jgi:Icc-related predicted phosphoesterase